MHIPVLLCGFLCGGLYGIVVGAAAPLLSSLLFGMPTLYPSGISMMFELAAYGLATGILFRLLVKQIGKTPGLKIATVYITLILSMLCGRVVWGITRVFMTTFSDEAFTFAAFIAGAFTGAVPAIITHIIVIPIIVVALMQARLIDIGKKTWN
jgi:hypothetical protein